MQRYDDFCNPPWIMTRFCIKTVFLLMYVKWSVCGHTTIVPDNSQ